MPSAIKHESAPDQLTIDAVVRLREHMQAALKFLEEDGSFKRGVHGWHDFWLSVGAVRVLLREIAVPNCWVEGTSDSEMQLLCDGGGCLIPLRTVTAEVIGLNLHTMSTGDSTSRFCLYGNILQPRGASVGYIAHDASLNQEMMLLGVRTVTTLLTDFSPERMPLKGHTYYL